MNKSILHFRRPILAVGAISLLLFLNVSAFGAEYTIRVTFSNPSELDAMNEDSRYYLPAEIRLPDVLNKGDLDLEYDPGRSLYYVHKKLLLQPGESKTFKVIVRDVWQIPAEEIEFLRQQSEDRLAALEESDLYESGEKLRTQILRELDHLQTRLTDPDLTVQQKIEAYRVGRERLRMIRLRVLLLGDFKAKIQDDIEYSLEPKSIALNISASNPSETDSKKQVIRQYLPEGIDAEILEDTQGFEIQFDPEKRVYYLQKEIDLAPKEEKKFTIRLEDRWRVRSSKLDGYSKEAKEVVDELVGSEFEKRSKYLHSEINRYIDAVNESQAKIVSIKDKMALFQDNTKRVEVIEKNIAELRRMLEIMRERERQKKLEEILKRVFKEAAWKIIYGTIFLLGLISILTYFLWWGQIKKRQTTKLKEIE